MELTERQQRELDYHRERAKTHPVPAVSFDVLYNPARRWWNAYWWLYTHLVRADLSGKRVLVVGCGFGQDAIRIATLGAIVSAFDLSEESLSVAKKLAPDISFQQMPAEQMTYPDRYFDAVVAVDILHHVDIQKTMQEVKRVSKHHARFFMDEIYSHSWTDLIRRSWLVEKILYHPMKKYIYGTDKPYITSDERKLTESDLEIVKQAVSVTTEEHFNFLVGRILPDYDLPSKADRLLLKALHPLGHLLAGRVVMTGRL